ncbi:hypothetical protein RHGRI_026514 [Rhododendron griersonianum]|uniref:Protein ACCUMULATION AND REPLICATION OF CHLOROPLASTS 3 n=1 Tax=Rhododendron griersonianum TaxID=479676 RepID=A0AAV6IT16_9ERIC|nr:hypothetical protein RHGRI_026514 [Rhododendron griersonianum]
MELHISTSLHKFPYPSLHPHSPKRLFFTSHLFHGFNFPTRLKPNSRTLRFALCSEKDSSPNGSPFRENQEEGGRSSREDSGFVEVIGIGSRKDAVLDFCLDSPSLWPSLRFWDIFFEDSLKVQLQQRYPGKDVTPDILEAPSVLLSFSKAVILVCTFLALYSSSYEIFFLIDTIKTSDVCFFGVATAGYGADHIRAVDMLKTVKSSNRLVVGIILKPFSFEGRRRQDEILLTFMGYGVLFLFPSVVDADVLLEKELVTLDEALKSANTAVLMAINGLSILTSESQKKLLDSQHDNVKELNVSDVMKILESYREAKIGFGAGHNMKISIMRAVYDCPFLSVGLKDLDGVVICILSSSAVIDRSDVNAFLHTFRQTTECMGGIIISLVQEPTLEPNLIMATVLTIGHIKHQVSQESSIFSRLAQHFPFIVNLLRRNGPQSPEGEESYFPEDPSFSEAINTDSGEMQNEIPAHSTAEDFGIYSTELQNVLSNNGVETCYLRGSDSSFEKKDVEYSETTTDSSDFDDLNVGGVPAFQREPLIPRNLGPGFRISEEWTNQGANDCRAISTLDNLRIYKLPVGVKPSEELKNCLNLSNTIHHQEKSGEEDMMAQTQAPPRMSWDALTDAGFEAVSEFYDSASAVFKGTDTDVCKKQGVLSARASSMLEAERESQHKWNPIVEISYRGGKYKGRCQGGLPEGKGRLSLRNGSIYEGMWRYGKQSGLGTFKFSNGDVFRGSWRDDVMHGKGWLYFHTGDRWFVNFWKGKANGEGRFYSKLGEIFFGHFKDGYRDGHFLCIDVDGSRYVENWDEGVLVSRKQLDADSV